VRLLPNFATASEHLLAKLIKAWNETPTKWYPLPVAVGALLLAAMDYRKRRARQEVDLNEDGEQVVRLRGPWQVFSLLLIINMFSLIIGTRTRCSSSPKSVPIMGLSQLP
jgi:hypothetical protein